VYLDVDSPERAAEQRCHPRKRRAALRRHPGRGRGVDAIDTVAEEHVDFIRILRGVTPR
jgi:hypothetical protein